MTINRRLDYVVVEMMEATARNFKARPLNLGGVAGEVGGEGAPPGGFIGWLPQTRVAYDQTEAATPFTVGSGSLLDNLNHIRYRLNTLESGILVVDEWDGNPTVENVTHLTFSGAVTVTELSPGHALVNITASGGGSGTPGGIPTQIQYNDGGSFEGAEILYESTGTLRQLRLETSGDDGSSFSIRGEDALADGEGGVVNVQAGDTYGTGTGGQVILRGGEAWSGGQGGSIILNAGNSFTSPGQRGGIIELVPGFGNPHGFVSINDGANDFQHRFRTENSTDHHDYHFPDEDGTFLMDAPADGVLYGREDNTWVAISGVAGSGVALTVEDDDGTPSVTNVDKIIVEGGVVTDLGSGDVKISVYGDGPDAFGNNYRINVSGNASSVTIALKTLAGNDPSTTDPIVVRLNNARKEITSALSFSIASGTNWFNAGGAELADQLINYFVYLIEETGASAGVKLGISRIPFARNMSYFVNTTTDEKYIKGNWTNFNGGDVVCNIGRVTGGISTPASHFLNFQTSEAHIVNRPIYNTELLVWVPQFGGFSVAPTGVFRYRLVDGVLFIGLSGVTAGTSNATTFTATVPFKALNITNFFQYSPTSWFLDNGVATGAPGTVWATPNSNSLTLRKNSMGTWTASGSKNAAFTIFMEI